MNFQILNTTIRWLSRYVASPSGPIGRQFERMRGTTILGSLDLLLESDRWERERLQAFKDENLRRLVAHVEQNCPWYVRFWAEAGVRPSDIRGEADLARLPVLTKTRFREAQHDGLTAANLDEMGAEMTASGDDRRRFSPRSVDRVAVWRAPVCFVTTVRGAAVSRIRRACCGDVRIRAGKPLRSRAILTLKDFLSQRLALNTFSIDDAILEDYYRRLYRFNAPVLRGYANSLALFARHVEKQGHPAWPARRMISSTSERLTDEMRCKIEDVLGCPVSNQYGFGEVNGVAFECREGRRIHVCEEHVVLETDDEAGHRVWDRDGTVVVTDLQPCDTAAALRDG